jgi:cytosine/adenosine deaminase-related metal-dependent hydrolase
LQHAEVSEIDGSGLTALPGAIAAHRHLWTETVGSRAAAAAADPTDLYRLLRLTLLQQLAAGVTCLHNCIIDIGAEHAETALLAQIDSGLRGRFSYPLADDGGSHRALRELQATWFSAPQEHLIDLGLAGPAEARPDVAELAWLPATGNHAAGEGTAEARHDAGALEMEPWIGSLSPGKRADLILVRGYQPGREPAPIPADRVEMVCIDGRVRKRNGVLLEPNEGLIRREGAEALARIIGGRAAPPSPATGARH